MGQAAAFVAELAPDEQLPGRGEIALIEDEVDDVEHGRQPVLELGATGGQIRDAPVADEAFGPHDPLGDGRLGHHEGTGDLGRREPGDQTQRQGDLRLLRQGRVAAREDQSQTVIRDSRRIIGIMRIIHVVALLAVEDRR